MRKLFFALLVMYATSAEANYAQLRDLKNACKDGTRAYFDGRDIDYRQEKVVTRDNADRYEVTVHYRIAYEDENQKPKIQLGTSQCYIDRNDTGNARYSISFGGEEMPLGGDALTCFLEGKFYSTEQGGCVNREKRYGRKAAQYRKHLHNMENH